MERYLIIVSPDRRDLFSRLIAAYAHRGEIEIRFDRRRGQPWTGPGDTPDRRSRHDLDTDLRSQGFIVIPRRELVGAFR